MASVAQVLKHLIHHTPALSQAQRAEFSAAVGADPALAVDRAPEPPQDSASEPESPADRVAQLEAELAAAQQEAAAPGNA